MLDTIRINVPLTKAEAHTLIEMARQERRHPREQAAYLLGQVLKQLGAPAAATQPTRNERAHD